MARPAICASEFDKRIAIYGKVIRSEEFKGMSIKIPFRCLQHGGVYYASPRSLIRGGGLRCCSSWGEKNRKARKIFDSKCLEHGKVKRVGEYLGTETKILFHCLEHNEDHYAYPSNILRGHGLECCHPWKQKNKELKSKFDERIEEWGRVERVGEYVDVYTKIQFKCLLHNEIYLATPSDILKGVGLHCCSSGQIANKKSKRDLDKVLANLGRVERVGEYVNMQTPILFRCLHHHETHLAWPKHVARGHGLSCCSGAGFESLSDLVHKSNSSGGTCVYLFNMSCHQGYLKLGISGDVGSRIDEQYGNFISSWHTNSRLEAYCVEQASLRDVMLPRSCPDELRNQNWPGYTEVIQCPEGTAIDVIQFYWDEMDHLGPYQFALDYLNPTSEETELLMSALPTC